MKIVIQLSQISALEHLDRELVIHLSCGKSLSMSGDNEMCSRQLDELVEWIEEGRKTVEILGNWVSK